MECSVKSVVWFPSIPHSATGGVSMVWVRVLEDESWARGYYADVSNTKMDACRRETSHITTKCSKRTAHETTYAGA
jgi:hypothetical protein